MSQTEFEKQNSEISSQISEKEKQLQMCRKIVAMNTKYGSESPAETLRSGVILKKAGDLLTALGAVGLIAVALELIIGGFILLVIGLVMKNSGQEKSNSNADFRSCFTWNDVRRNVLI